MSGYRFTADFITRSLLHMWKPILQILGNMSDWFRSKSVGTRPCYPVTCMLNMVLISREMKKFLDRSGQAVARWVTGRERCLTGPSTLGPHRPRAPCRRWEGALPERAACPTQEKYVAGKNIYNPIHTKFSMHTRRLQNKSWENLVNRYGYYIDMVTGRLWV